MSSGSDEQVGSSSQSTVTQTNVDEDEMEDVVDGEETVEDEEEEESDVVRELLSKHSVWLGM